MQKNHYFPLSLIAVALFSGCSSLPQNSSLADAHSSYNSARSDPQVTNLAPLELKDAGDTLNKADHALNKGKSEASVNQLAYVAKQQVGVAQETAKRKTAELAVTNAGAERNEVRLEARTAEADAAKQELGAVRKLADQQANALDAANENAARDQAYLKSVTAEANAANEQVVIAQEVVDEQAAALANASVNAEVAQAIIAQQEMQLKELNAQKTARGMVITLGDVLFSTDKAELKSAGMHSAQKLADFLKQYPQHKVLVEGYTDSTGSASHNQELSERRANAVRTALIGMGISGDRVAMRGFGEEFPVAGNDSAANRQLNRRVEIILSDANGLIASR